MNKTDRNEILRNAAALAALAILLVVGVVSAYLTSVDDVTDTFTVGDVEIELAEPDADAFDSIVPNQAVAVDPAVTNVSESGNPCYVFMKVTVPKKEVVTADILTGACESSAVMQDLFQLNSTESDLPVWGGANTDGVNNTLEPNWKVISTDTSGSDSNVYLLSYVVSPSSAASVCKALEADESTKAFDSVTFANVTDGQGLEGEAFDLKIEAFAVQTDALGGCVDDSNVTASDVWAVIAGQIKETESAGDAGHDA